MQSRPNRPQSILTADRTPKRRPNSLIGSALLLAGPSANPPSRDLSQTDSKWQVEAWEMFDVVSELRAGTSWIANALSRINLTVARMPINPGDDPTPIDVDDQQSEQWVALIQDFAGGSAGQGQVLNSIALQLSIAGEGYIYGRSTDDGADWESWHVLSTEEVDIRASGDIQVANPETGVKEPVGDADIIIKVWRSHPRKSSVSDSPTRALLPVLREIAYLSSRAQVEARSRLLGNGVLLMPSEAEFEKASPESQQDKFLIDLMKSASMAVENPNDPAAGVPMVARLPAELIDAPRHMTFWTELDQVVGGLRDSAIRRLALGLDMPPEVLLGLGDSNHWCHDDTTTVYTRRGWLGPDEIEAGDEAWTMNPETGLAEWQPVTDVYRADVVGEPMRHFENQRHSSMTTMNHRWATRTSWGSRRWRTTAELSATDMIPLSAARSEVPISPKYDDALVEVLAWYWTEGHEPSGTIAQSHTANPGRVDLIRRAITDAFGPDSFTERIQSNESSYGGPITVFRLRSQYAAILRELAPNKRVDLDVIDAMTDAQLHLFIDRSCQGDGWHYRSGKLDIWQRDRDALAAFERAGLLAGYAVSEHPCDDGWCISLLKSDHTRPVKAAEQAARTGKTATDEIVEYSGVVWCPTVAEHHVVLARRNGHTFWTGNSAWQIEESAITLHVEPLAELVCHAITVGYLRPAAQAAGIPDFDQWMVWYDTTDLQTRPDKSAVAAAAFDRGELSAAALLRESGLDDSDAPGDDERKRRLLIEVAMAQPSYTAAILSYLKIADLALPTPDETIVVDEPAPVTEERSEPDRADQPPEAASVDIELLVEGADGIVERALEVAGRRLASAASKGQKGGAATIDLSNPSTLHTRINATEFASLDHLLADAWDRAIFIAVRRGVDKDSLVAALDGYTRSLIANGVRHDIDRLRIALGG